MKSFIKGVAIFFFIWFIITGIIDFYYTKDIKKQHIREIDTWERILGDSIDANVFIFGSSRAMSHYKPSIIDSITGLNCYNFGLDGKTTESDIMLYNILKKHVSNYPKYVLWDIYFYSFDYASKYGDKQFTPYLFNQEIWNSINNDNLHFTIIDKYIPLLRYWREQVFPIYNGCFKDSKKGYSNLNERWSPEGMLEAKLNPKEYTIEPELALQFKHTIKELKANGTNVIIVSSPFYFEGLDGVANISSIIDSIQLYANQVQCPLYNFTNDPICYDTSFFFNAWHMNDKGASIFSTKIAHILDSLEKHNNNI